MVGSSRRTGSDLRGADSQHSPEGTRSCRNNAVRSARPCRCLCMRCRGRVDSHAPPVRREPRTDTAIAHVAVDANGKLTITGGVDSQALRLYANEDTDEFVIKQEFVV